jgi:hypothetical protein
MSDQNKISEEHLVSLKEFTGFFTNAKTILGEVTLRYEADKESILSQVKAKNEAFVEFQKELETAYGKVNISIETGEYTEVELEDQKAE